MGPADDLVRLAVATHVGVHPDVVTVIRACPTCASSQHGRPVVLLDGAPRPAPWVSLSRAGELVVVAVTDAGPVGVDVEVVPDLPRPDFATFALHTGERAASAWEQATTWVRKEAVLKAVGLGLRLDPREVGVSPADEPPAVRSWPGTAPLSWMSDLERPGHAACVAVLVGEQPDGPQVPEVTVRWAGPAATPRRARPRTAR